MASADYDATPREVRTFALLQVAMTTAFVVVLFLALGGLDGGLPPWWLILVQLAAVAGAAFLADRVWLRTEPLSPDHGLAPEQLRAYAVGVFASQTVRKLWICNAPIGLAILAAFIADHGAWPLVIGGVPGIGVLAFEVWPSLRNLTMTEVLLDDDGVESGLVDSFVDA